MRYSAIYITYQNVRGLTLNKHYLDLPNPTHHSFACGKLQMERNSLIGEYHLFKELGNISFVISTISQDSSLFLLGQIIDFWCICRLCGVMLSYQFLKSPYSGTIKSKLSNWNFERHLVISIEYCIYHFFLFSIDLWTCISTHERKSTPELVVAVPPTKASAHWYRHSMLRSKLALYSCKAMTLCGPKFAWSFLGIRK